MISHEINKPFPSDGSPIWHLTDVGGQAADVGSSDDNAKRDQLLRAPPPPRGQDQSGRSMSVSGAIAEVAFHDRHFRCSDGARPQSLVLPTHSNGRAVRGSVADGLGAMPALRRTEIAGELAALNGRLVDLLLTSAPMAELMAVQAQVRSLLDQLEEASEPPGAPGDSSQRSDLGFA